MRVLCGSRKANAALFHVAANHLGVSPREHLNNLGLRAAPAIQPGHRDQHFITIKYLIHLASRQKQIVTPSQRARKAVAVAVPHDPAAQQVHALRHAIGTASARDNLPFALHGTQALTQRVQIALLTQPQLLRNAAKANGASAAFQ